MSFSISNDTVFIDGTPLNDILNAVEGGMTRVVRLRDDNRVIVRYDDSYFTKSESRRSANDVSSRNLAMAKGQLATWQALTEAGMDESEMFFATQFRDRDGNWKPSLSIELRRSASDSVSRGPNLQELTKSFLQAGGSLQAVAEAKSLVGEDTGILAGWLETETAKLTTSNTSEVAQAIADEPETDDSEDAEIAEL